MKTSLISRLSALCLTLVCSTTLAMADPVIYTESPIVAKSGYWTIVTDPQLRDHSTVRFYNDQHELLYEEQLNGVYLDPSKSLAAHHRISKMLGTTLQQVQRLNTKCAVSSNMVALNRHTQRLYAVR
ncbi:hypothetical protein [Hymenobacter wooponensis]|uniref:Uncharacterized protein n=1 Tax=Hymenobacter wooponensis TaxID=1525360 RepID=A0A4Z0MMG6_9BACT|nr:hypothetical protein [Hymenobacter wooponensis]TGD80771.1 hypothetical protein EU557_13270 [Hymenobacter wooponensis]